MGDSAERLCRSLDQEISAPTDATIQALTAREGDFIVLGAAGKMGFHLCWMLRRALDALGRSSRVTAVSRFSTVRAQDDFATIGCQTLAADLSDPDQLAQLPQVDNVFYLAGVKFGTASDSALLDKMNVVMPRLVAGRFRTSDIVAFSTGCVYSFVEPQTGGSKESDATEPVGDYANSCKGRERAFFEASDNYGTRSVLIRLNYSIDCRYGVLVDLAEKIANDQAIDVTMGYVNLIWQGDALQHAIQSLNHAAAPPLVLNVTGTDVLSVRDLAQGLADRLGKQVSFTGKEAPTAWLNNASRSHAMFGKPAVGIEEMLDRVVQWRQQGGPLLGKPTHFETRDGNY